MNADFIQGLLLGSFLGGGIATTILSGIYAWEKAINNAIERIQKEERGKEKNA